MADRKMIYLDDAIDAVAEGLKRTFVEYRDVAEKMLNKVPSAQPELIEQGAYVRGFEQGRTQGMIDAQGELMSRLINNTIKAEWTNADALDLQPTCNQLATNTISRQVAIDALADYIHNVDKVIGTGHLSADNCKDAATSVLADLPSTEPDYTELKREFILMASYIDVFLECSDEQKETLNGFISRLSEHMPWTEKD